MSTPTFTPKLLTPKELETFRRDSQDKEREIQKYIGIYLSGLVVVTGWVIGPQSRPIIAMAIGNHGYNVYAFLIFAVLNIVFTIFLINKSLVIHEIMQFMTYLAPTDSPFRYWESWRRSRQSVTKPVRAIYTSALAVLPICASALLMFGTWNVIFGDPQHLLQLLGPTTTTVSDNLNTPNVTGEELRSVFHTARYWYVLVLLLHCFPIYFFYHNWLPTRDRWKRIRKLQQSEKWFDELKPISQHNEMENSIDATQEHSNLTASTNIVGNSATPIKLFNKQTGQSLGEITPEELDVLRSGLLEEHSNDRDYFITNDTIEFLEQAGVDRSLSKKLKKALSKSKAVEIEWRQEP
ncbi:MAG TPA: hypothetical protein VI306_11895 [Pyrinomonadaceae bacterium]